MAKRIGLAALFLGVLAVGIAYASAFLPQGPPGWATWLFAAGTAATVSAVMAVGAARDGSVGRLGYVFAFVFLLVSGGFAVLLLLPDATSPDATLWLGLPAGAAIVLYVLGILPVLVVPVAYALTFDRMTLDSADLERIRRLREGVSVAGPAAGIQSLGGRPERRGRSQGLAADADARGAPEEPDSRADGRVEGRDPRTGPAR
jgi:hypothetical protein